MNPVRKGWALILHQELKFAKIVEITGHPVLNFYLDHLFLDPIP
jgi:hypothetical protein